MKARISLSRLTGLVALAASLSLVVGCVGVIPLPTCSKKPVYGQSVTPAQTAFIQPGKTTRAEVVAELGGDYVALPMKRAIAYSWELPGGGGVWWYCVVLPYGGAAGGGDWVGGWRGFLVAFDDRGVVAATAFKKLSTRRSLDENMRRWVAKLPGHPGAPAALELSPQPAFVSAPASR